MALDRVWGSSLEDETFPLLLSGANPPPGESGRHTSWPRPVDRRCGGCGYGIAAERIPDRCPMCGGRAWRTTRAQRNGSW